VAALLLGHRGALARAPENTLASLRRAVADGAVGFEFDVRMTADGRAALLHDATVDRTTNGNGALASLAATDMAGLDAGSYFGEAFAGEPVPLLDTVLDEFLGSAFLAMEMKETLSEAVLVGIAERLRANREAQLLAASFEAEALAKARDFLPAAPRALILKRDQPLPSDEVARALGLWGVFARTESIDERFVVDCRRSGLNVYAYVVSDGATAARFSRIGVGGLISDDPGALVGTYT
jgi:glycerophosphoryl diester phosphodiesterase